MRGDWVPTSAALLVTGAMALALASLVTEPYDGARELLANVESDDGRWLAAAVIYLLASACLTLGLPAILLVAQERARLVGGAGALLLTLGFIGLAGYGMVVAFFRALVVTGAVDPDSVDAATSESGLSAVLLAWLTAFLLGELLVTVALFRAASVPSWVPAVLAGHLVVIALDGALPDTITRIGTLLFALGFSGVGMAAAAPQRLRPA